MDKHPYFRRKTPDELLHEIHESNRGKLKLYVGFAPGVGKTYKMLQDAHDMAKEGIDVVIGLIETHSRKETEKQVGTLEHVLVLADHETGGLTVESDDSTDESGDGLSKEDGPFQVAHSDQKFMVDWTTGEHSAVDVPITAIGKNAHLFEGTYENTYIHDALLKAMGIR